MVALHPSPDLSTAVLAEHFQLQVPSRPEWIEQFNKVRQAYNVNVLTQAAAAFVLERLEVLEEQAAAIRRERESLKRDLSALKGLELFPSEANFFLVRVADADRSFEALRRQGVLVRNLHPGLKGCLRLTVGTPAVPAAAIADEASPSVWTIDGERNRVHLMGSVHYLQPGDFALGQAGEAAWREADEIN